MFGEYAGRQSTSNSFFQRDFCSIELSVALKQNLIFAGKRSIIDRIF